MTSWCILRTAPSRTLQLASSLAEAGFEVWAPTETFKPKPPELKEFEKPRPLRKVPELVTRPLLPSFVFANSDRLDDLLQLALSPALQHLVWDSSLRRMVTKGHPAFRVFHTGDRVPLVPDVELAPLRRIEGRRARKPRGKAPEWKVGDRVRLTEGACEGLRGEVVRVNRKDVDVVFPGSGLSFTFSAWLLVADLDFGEEQSENLGHSDREVRAAA